MLRSLIAVVIAVLLVAPAVAQDREVQVYAIAGVNAGIALCELPYEEAALASRSAEYAAAVDGAFAAEVSAAEQEIFDESTIWRDEERQYFCTMAAEFATLMGLVE